jgi:uncharacterized membrane protein
MKASVNGEGRAPDVPQLDTSGRRTFQKAKVPPKAGGLAAWLVPVGLLVLSAIPLAAGAFRLTGLAGGPQIIPADARFSESPLPVVLHIVSVSVFAILGAFQFATGIRRRWPGWHRAAGRLLVGSGLLVGGSALWLTLFYSHPAGGGELLYALRLLFGSAMVLSIVLGFAAIRRGDVTLHRAWMMRGYAIGLGAGTQVLTLLIGELVGGPPDAVERGLLNGAGWAINLALAEWIIRRRPSHPTRTGSPARATGYDHERPASVTSAVGAL